MTGPARNRILFLTAVLILRAPHILAQPTRTAAAAFTTYASSVESRLARQHASPDTFLDLPADPTELARLRSGQLLIEKIPTPETPGALLHHWRATAFVPHTTAADFEHLLRDFPAYPQEFAPQILSSTVLSRTPAGTLLRLRTRQHHVLTVVLDTTCDVTFASLDLTHRYSISRSTRVDEIASPGTPAEHALSPADEHGFLYRLNTYWSYEQRDDGLFLQIESLSLTRDIPHGLGWAIQPYLESIPRESLVFTLTSARNTLNNPKTGSSKLAAGN